MKKAIGILLVISGFALLAMILYSKIFTESDSLSWFALILPTLFIFQGFAYLRSTVQISLHASNEEVFENDEAKGPDFDRAKRSVLVEKLKAMPDDAVIPIEDFFDGNFNDLGSIGCNLYPNHPGIEKFRSTFKSLLSRSDVSQIYAHIQEIEPDEESWPFTDRVYVFGSINLETLRQVTEAIEPTEVGEASIFLSNVPNEIAELDRNPIRVLWWD